ncbi:hypothetical protein BS47DRAFT_536746 [Hydnum rufescens UP504]|uniref:Uncharacterized protein n=1 Tax=Hydnum rufescens UP504 TaxID=1448309 RepID=A0A9P6AHP5_9AGAM|nr:hypothetical protein BS47DRAFT_536746 [Hydnum rufescens UP504]
MVCAHGTVFQFRVFCEGEPLPEYSVVEEGNKGTCWVPSQEGKVCCVVTHSDVSYWNELQICGTISGVQSIWGLRISSEPSQENATFRNLFRWEQRACRERRRI